MRRYISIFIVLLILCVTFILPISSKEKNDYIFDDAEIFSSDDLHTIEETIIAMTNHNSKYIVGTIDKYYYDKDILADEFCDAHDISQSENLVLLIISVYDSEIYYDMYTYGTAWNNISDAEVNRIIYHKDVYNNIKSYKILEGTLAFLKYSEKAYNGHLSMPLGKIIIISIVSGIIISVIVCASVIAKYKTKLKSASYPIEKYAKLKLNDKQDIFLGSSISKTRVQSSSSSSRGGGGGGGGHRGGA